MLLMLDSPLSLFPRGHRLGVNGKHCFLPQHPLSSSPLSKPVDRCSPICRCSMVSCVLLLVQCGFEQCKSRGNPCYGLVKLLGMQLLYGYFVQIIVCLLGSSSGKNLFVEVWLSSFMRNASVTHTFIPCK